MINATAISLSTQNEGEAHDKKRKQGKKTLSIADNLENMNSNCYSGRLLVGCVCVWQWRNYLFACKSIWMCHLRWKRLRLKGNHYVKYPSLLLPNLMHTDSNDNNRNESLLLPNCNLNAETWIAIVMNENIVLITLEHCINDILNNHDSWIKPECPSIHQR